MLTTLFDVTAIVGTGIIIITYDGFSYALAIHASISLSAHGSIETLAAGDGFMSTPIFT